MPQMQLSEAQDIIARVVENPDGSQAITDRQIATAVATVLVGNALLFNPPQPNV